jgi:hypothetical protein
LVNVAAKLSGISIAVPAFPERSTEVGHEQSLHFCARAACAGRSPIHDGDMLNMTH